MEETVSKNKRKRKISPVLIVLIVILVLVIAGAVGYSIYRHPDTFRNLKDDSLDETATIAVRDRIMEKESPEILVAYFSYSGTTKGVAEKIAESTGGTLFEINTVKTYSNVYTESNREIRRNERPELSSAVADMDKYDIVFVGFPVWWHATPAPINTFLESYDLKDKLIIPFCTSGGSEMDEPLPTFLDSCDGIAVYGGKRVGSSEVDAWLKELGIMNGSSTEAASNTVPEAIQSESVEIKALADLPQYEYSEREISVSVDGQNIYGVAYIPDTGAAKLPMVICSHGLGGNYRSCAAYAEQLASHGIAAYCFDFRGDGGSRSDGSTTQMSVMTEVSDLEAIINAAKEWDFVDSSRIALLGTSQGGIVSAITAARHADETAGLLLCYPAFLVQDTVHERFDSLDEVPDNFQFEWITAGRPYIEDMWDYDVYSEIGNYKKPVLLMHGDADSIVPISYAERAAEVYPDADYYVINGAGHGFSGAAFEEAMAHIFAYIQEIGLLEAE